MGIQEAIGATVVALMTALVMVVQSQVRTRRAVSERPPPDRPSSTPHIVYISASELREIVRDVVREELKFLGCHRSHDHD